MINCNLSVYSVGEQELAFLRKQYILRIKKHTIVCLGATLDARAFALSENVIRVMGLEKEAPNVVTEVRFRDLVASGYCVEVVCKEDAVKKGPNWHGVWILRAVSDEGVVKLLVTARTRTSHNDIKIREIRTVTGVISFLQGIGFSHADIPLEAGKRTVHKLTSDEVARLRA